MESIISICGIYNCMDCEHRSANLCPGCEAGNVQLKDSCQEICAVYTCTRSHGITSCNDCTEISCSLKRSVEAICPLRSQFEKRRWWAGRMSRAMESRKTQQIDNEDSKISGKVVSRLRWYLTVLDTFISEGYDSISSWQLAEKVGVNAALIRKDLSRFGDFGTPSYGYKASFLRDRIRGILHLDKPRGLVWIGCSCFRMHTAAVEKLETHNCSVLAVFDVDKSEIGTDISNLTVYSTDRLAEILPDLDVSVAVIAISGSQAQTIAKTVTDLGIKAVLNLSGQLLLLPEHVQVSNFDVTGELIELSYYSEH